MQTEQLRSIIKELAGGKIFSVDFTKKNGEARTMLCRLDVTKYLKGGVLGYDQVEKGVMSVYDIQSAGYRMINLETVTEIRANGQVYRFER